MKKFVLNKKEINLLPKQGFSMVELIVSMAILGFITSVVFANYPAFKRNLSLKRTAQDVALTIRQAQVYGLSVKEFAGAGIKFPGYGVNFDRVGSPSSFILFADAITEDKYYTVGEIVNQFNIQTGDVINDLCGDGVCGKNQINVVFLRPNPEVFLNDGIGGVFSKVEIIIMSPEGDTKKITVWLSGQISTE